MHTYVTISDLFHLSTYSFVRLSKILFVSHSVIQPASVVSERFQTEVTGSCYIPETTFSPFITHRENSYI